MHISQALGWGPGNRILVSSLENSRAGVPGSTPGEMPLEAPACSPCIADSSLSRQAYTVPPSSPLLPLTQEENLLREPLIDRSEPIFPSGANCDLRHGRVLRLGQSPWALQSFYSVPERCLCLSASACPGKFPGLGIISQNKTKEPSFVTLRT